MDRRQEDPPGGSGPGNGRPRGVGFQGQPYRDEDPWERRGTSVVQDTGLEPTGGMLRIRDLLAEEIKGRVPRDGGACGSAG